MNPSTFLAYTTAGSLVWACVLTSAGYLLKENFTTVGKYIDPTAKAIVALGVAHASTVSLSRKRGRLAFTMDLFRYAAPTCS